MEDDRYPSLERFMFEIWMHRLGSLASLPSRKFSGLVNQARRYYNEASDATFYYLTKDTVFDLNAGTGQEWD